MLAGGLCISAGMRKYRLRENAAGAGGGAGRCRDCPALQERQTPLYSGHGKPGAGEDGRRDSRADHAAAQVQAEKEQQYISSVPF